MAGVDPTIVIPTLSLNRPDGLTLAAAAVGSVSVNMSVDPAIRAGADPAGRVRLYAPPQFASGSSVAHFDTVASRNLLMEPAINPDLTHNVQAPFDLTLELFHDIGWNDRDADGVLDDDDCQVFSDKRATLVIGGYRHGRGELRLRQRLHDGGHDHCVADRRSQPWRLRVGWSHRLPTAGEEQDLLTGAQKGAVQSAAARTNAP